MKKNQKIIIILVLLFIIGGFSFVIIKRLNEKKAREESLKNLSTIVTTVTVVKPKLEQISEFFLANGLIMTSESVDITSKVAGKVTNLFIKEGEKLSKGQLIATIEATDLNNQLLQAKAQLDSAKANLDLLNNGSLKEQIKQSESLVNQLKANLAQVQLKIAFYEKEFARNSKLFKEEIITKQQFDTSKNQLDSLKKEKEALAFQITSSQESLNLIKIGSRKEQIRVGKANYEQSLAYIKTLSDQLDNYAIKAPIDGIISKKNIEAGTIISPATVIATISKNDKVEAEINIPEHYLSKVKLNSKVVLKFNETEALEVAVTKISPVIDTISHTFKAKAFIDNNKEKVKQGMSFEAKVFFNQKAESLLLPSDAVIDSEGKKIVYLISKDNKALEKEITIGWQSPEKIEILKGLSSKDEVILTGNNFIKAGDSVQIEKL